MRVPCLLAVLAAGGCIEGAAEVADFPTATPQAAATPAQLECAADWHQRRVGDATVCSPEPLRAPQHATWACPAGWTDRTTDAGPGGCEPPLSACAPGQRLSLDGGGCVEVGGDCAGRSLPADLPADRRVWHVAPGASGTGESGQPLGTIEAALAVADAGDVIALAPGEYDGALEVDKAISLWGTCPATTRITAGAFAGADPSDLAHGRGVVTVFSGELELRDVAITGEREGIVVTGGSLNGRGLWIHDTLRRGIHAGDSAIELADVLIEGTRHAADDDVVRGRGLQLEPGATLRMIGAEVRGAVSAGIRAEGASVGLEDVLVRDVRFVGVLLSDATATLTRVAVSDVFNTGVLAGWGSSAALTDVFVGDLNTSAALNFSGDGIEVLDADLEMERVRVANAERFGLSVHDGGAATGSQVVTDGCTRGLDARSGADVTLTDITFTDVPETGFLVAEEGSRASLSDLTVAGAPDSPPVGGFVNDGASVSIQSATLDLMTPYGLGVIEGATLELSDVQLSRVVGERDILGGAVPIGIAAVDGSTLDAQRILLTDVTDNGILLVQSEGDLIDIWVERARASRPEFRAFGIGAGGAGHTRGQRWTIASCQGTGILVERRAEMSVADLVVVDTVGAVTEANIGLAWPVGIIGRGHEDTRGVGVVVAAEGELDLDRALLARTAGTGLAAVGAARLSARDLIVEDGIPYRRVRGDGEPIGGHGVVVSAGTLAELERLEVLDNHAIGVLVSGAELSLASAIISGVAAGSVGGDLVTWRTDGLADCIQASDGAQLTLEDTDLSDCDRAGILFDDSDAAVVSMNLNGTRIVTQGVSVPQDPRMRELAQPAGALLPVARDAPDQLTADALFGNLLRDD